MTAAELDAICRQLTGSAEGGGAAVWNGAADAIATLRQRCADLEAGTALASLRADLAGERRALAESREQLRMALIDAANETARANDAERELAEAKADGERLDWYFTQRRYSVSIGAMGVLLHDDKPNERYATLIRYSEDSVAFPSVRAAIDAARKGE